MNGKFLFQRLLALSGIANNFLLAMLIVYKSPKKLGSYKYLMMYITVFEMFYSFLDFLSLAEIHSAGSAFFSLIDSNIAFLPIWLMSSVNLTFCSLFGSSLMIFAVHFVYRYLVITGSRYVKTNQTEKVIGLIVFTILVGFLWSATVYSLFSPTVYSDQFMSEKFLKSKRLDLSEIVYVGCYLHPLDRNGNSFIHWPSVYGILVMVLIIMSSLLTVFYFGYLVYQKMNQLLLTSAVATKNLQSQLFWALVFQTLIPVLLMHLPMSVPFMFAVFDSSVELLGDIPTVSIFLYPALDPLPSFFIIKNYRDAILEFFGCLKKKSTRSTREVRVKTLTSSL